jgi:hypothetical protein
MLYTLDAVDMVVDMVVGPRVKWIRAGAFQRWECSLGIDSGLIKNDILRDFSSWRNTRDQ